MHTYKRLTCVVKTRVPSYGGKGDHGRDGSLSLSLPSCVRPRPRARFVDGKRLRSFFLSPFLSCHAVACRRTREHNYATRRHEHYARTLRTMHEHYAPSSLDSLYLPFASPGRAFRSRACLSSSADS